MDAAAVEYVVGVDIGGTNMVAAVLAAADARVVSRESVPTLPSRGPADGFARLGDLIARVVASAGLALDDIGGIGVGCTGPLDSVRGLVNNPYTLPTWVNAPLVDTLTQRFQRPVVLLNDAHVAALGEVWNGAGRGYRHVIYITVGTGIGAGIIVNGRLHRGVGLMAGEVGHQAIDLNGPECYCGGRGCLEMLAAAPAISRRAAARAEPGGLMLRLAGGDPAAITPRLVYEAALQGDAAACDLMHETGVYLGIGIINLLNTLAPEMVILGGGVMQGWSLLYPAIHETIDSRQRMVPYDDTQIVPAALSLNAGVTGAARAILDHLADQARGA